MIYLLGAVIIIVCVSPVILWLLALLHDGRKLRLEMRLAHRRRVEDEERKKLMAEPWPPDDETKPYPPDFPEGGAFV